MTCGKGGLHCVCGIHSSDERFVQSESKHCVLECDEYKFIVTVKRVDCSNCGYVSVTAEVENPYDPVVIKK